MSVAPDRIGHLISQQLIDALRYTFPLSRPNPNEPDRKIWTKSGNQEVIEFLEQQLADAVTQAMENSHVPST